MDNSTKTPYVAVFLGDREAQPPNAPIGQEDGDEPPTLDSEDLMREFWETVELRPEQGRRLGLFYQQAGFVLDNGPDPFENVPKEYLTRAPGEEDPDYVFFNSIRDMILDEFKMVNKSDIQLRFALSPSRRPFKSLETSNSLNEYSLVMKRFLRFMVLLAENAVQQVRLPASLQNAGTLYRETNDLNTACELIMEVLRTDPKICVPFDPFTLFIRFCATQNPGDYMKCENVERLIAKVCIQACCLLITKLFPSYFTCAASVSCIMFHLFPWNGRLQPRKM